MKNTNNLPTIDEDALDGVAGGSSLSDAIAMGARDLAAARKNAVSAPFKLASMGFGAASDAMKGVSDFLSKIGDSLG